MYLYDLFEVHYIVTISVIARKNDLSPLFMFLRNRDFKVYTY